jgi:hypothetical protein
MRKLLVAAFALLLFTGNARAACQSLDGANLGAHWYGPKRSMEELKGHVVLWENWGYN